MRQTGAGKQYQHTAQRLDRQCGRTYYDGIPLELLGGGIQLNNIPVNTVARVDVYKGVVPVDVSTDALAGGINIVTKQPDYDYLDASYKFGSFNTHIGTLNAAKRLGDHLLVSISSFYNYSDNNYLIRAIQRTAEFFRNRSRSRTVPHSAHQSSMVMGGLSLVDVKWADKLSYSASYNQRFDEIQHGIRLGNKAVGEADLSRDVFIHSVQYQKRLFTDRLLIDYFGNYSIAQEFIDDSTTNVYNWFGEVVATNNRNGSTRVTLASARAHGVANPPRKCRLYIAPPNHTLKLASFFSRKYRGAIP